MSALKPFDTSDLESKLIWEKPERKDQAGSLLVFGGVSLKLKEVDTAFKKAKKCGIGSAQALVPESLARVFKRDEQYLTPINFDNYYGLSENGQKTLQDEFALSYGLILADIGNSSATERRLVLTIAKTFKPVVLTDLSINLVLNYPHELLNNKNITLVINLQNLQKIIQVCNLKLDKPLLSSSSFNQKIEVLAKLNYLLDSKIVLLEEKRVLAVDNDFYFSREYKNTAIELSACLICWQIWASQLNILEQVFAATHEL